MCGIVGLFDPGRAQRPDEGVLRSRRAVTVWVLSAWLAPRPARG